MTTRFETTSRWTTAGLAALLLYACAPSEQPAPAQPDGGSAPDGAPAPDAGPAEPAEERPVPGLADVWAVHDGERIERDDLSHPARAGNTAWRDGRVTLFGARNEVIAFQLVVEADAAGIDDLDVRLRRLRRRGGGGEIVYAPPAADPTAYVGRPIQIFTQHYMLVSEPSRANWVYEPGGPAVPADPTGWKPVQLVPENARPGRGGLPIDVAPEHNQGLWIDLYLGKDLPAGIYDGEVELRAGGGLRRVPVELEVLDFALPDESSLTAMVYFEPEQVVRYQGRALDDAYHRFAHRHRVELVHAYDRPGVEAALGRFDGSHFTPAAGYDGPGVGVGNRVVPASFYGPGSGWDERGSAWQRSDAWMTFLAGTVPHALTFLYMPDEPGPAQYDRIRTIAANIKGNPGPGNALPIFATTAYRSALDGAIDIWCSFPGSFDVARAVAERAKGNRYWFYNGQRPATGALTVEAPATDARVVGWAAFKHDVEVYFYWHAVHWRHNSQKQGERDQDVWNDPVTFDNRGQPNKPLQDQGFIHGDGVLVYPGEERLHPERDRGIAGPVGSIRLANLRRGIQDHLYLSLARARGLDAPVSEALGQVVPAVFSDAGATVTFAETGDVYEAARYALGRALAASE